jgi:hypothetical protein
MDYNQAPQARSMSFDGVNQAVIVQKTDFSGRLNENFIVRMWMKHTYGGNNEKEHIFCKSDEKCKQEFVFLFFNILDFLVKNRHHSALLIQGDYLKLVIRKGPLSSNDKNVYASEWMWKISQLNDDQWHSYKLFVNYPNKVLVSFYM